MAAAVALDQSKALSARPPLVHIVDDDSLLRGMIADLLEEQGLRVVEHADSYAALEQACELQPDLALLDVNLPGMDGITLCARLRQIEAYRHIPIAMLTGVSDDEAVRAAFAVGATDYIPKLLPPAVIKRKASQLIRAHQAERQLRETQERMRAIVQYSNDAILTLDETLRIIEANPSAEALLGAVVGRLAEDVIDAEHALSAILPGLAQTGRAIEATVTTALGFTKTVELTGSYFSNLGQRRYTLALRDITGRKRAEQALRDLSQLLVSAFDALPEEVALLDANGVIVMVNERWRAFAEANGLPASANYGLGSNYLRLCDGADPERHPEAQALAEAIRGVIAGRTRQFSLEYPCDSPNEQRWFLAQALAVQGASQARVLISHEEVTERARAPLLMALPLESLPAAPDVHQILDKLPYGVALLDNRGRIAFANPALASLLGETPARCRGRRGKRYLSRQGYQQWKRQSGRSFPGSPAPSDGAPGSVAWQSVTLRKSDGCFVSARLALESINGGQAWLALVEDLTEQRRADEALRQHNQEWEITVDALPSLILLESAEGRIRRCNRAVADFLNRPYAVILGQSSGKLFFGREGGSLLEAIEDPAQFQFPNDDRWFQIRSFWIAQERGIGTGWAHLISDITMRRWAEQDMRRLVAAVEQVGEGVATFDRRGRMEFCNPAFAQITGVPLWKAVGRHFLRLGIGPADPAIRQEILASLARGQGWQGRYLARRRDGSTYHEQLTASPVRDERGALRNVVIVCRDMTEAVRYEAIAEAANVTENANYIFSAIRHEMGNPINSIKTALTVLRRAEPPSLEAVNACLDRCLSEIGRVEYLLRTLRSFSFFETPNPKAQPLAPFLERFCDLVRNGLSARQIALERRFSPSLGLARFDERGLHQALMNLASNAIDALADQPEPRITILAKRHHQWVSIAVRDNGCGIDPEQTKRIFKPFYTSKPSGTGLGLVITQKLLSKMNGTIELHPLAAGGCEAVITLEAADDGQET